MSVLNMTVFLGFFAALISANAAFGREADGWRGRVIYFSLVDRFVNGNTNNDRAHGYQECNDSGNIHTYQGGDLAGVTGKLDYIKNLGADALWITPLYKGVPFKQGANCGFPGYWADFTLPYSLQIDPRFGQAADFDRLIGAARDRNIKVMLDMVVNHAGYGAALTHQKPEWFTSEHNCHWQGDPDIYCPLAGLPDFDHRRQDVQEYLVSVHQAWLRRFAFDGIRMDTVKHVEPWYFGNIWTPKMRSERDNLFVVGELLDEHSFDRFDRYLNAGFDGLFNFPLRRALIESFAKGHSVDIAAGRMAETLHRFGSYRSSMMVNLLDNHDVRRFLEEMPQHVSREDVMQRYQLALSALLTLPGIPQIYYGNEVGMYGGHDPHNRRFMPSWAFTQEGRRSAGRAAHGFVADPDRIFTHVKRLLALRSRFAALRTGDYSELWRQNGAHNANVWAYLRSLPGGNVIVAINNGERWTDHPLPVPVAHRFPDGTVFRDLLSPDAIGKITVQNGILPLHLPGRTTVVLVPE